MDEDSWASSPSTDLLLEIFRRLNASDVVRCACACKTWRRAIIANASSLHPIPDRFVPDLLLGFFHEYWYKNEKKGMRIQPAPGPFESVLAATVNADGTGRCCDDDETPCSFIPTGSAGGGVDLALYSRVVSSRDGYLPPARRR